MRVNKQVTPVACCSNTLPGDRQKHNFVMDDASNQTFGLDGDGVTAVTLSAQRAMESANLVAHSYQDIAKCKIIQVAGDDRYGRKVITFSASKLPPHGQISHDRLLQYIRHVLEMYVESDYIIVYFHHGLTSNNRPSFKWLQTAYREVDRKYKKNLKNLYIVHPTNIIKMVFNIFLPVISWKFGRKLMYCNYIHELERDIDVKKLTVPSSVREYDRHLLHKTKSRLLAFQSHAAPATAQFGVSLEFMKSHNNGDVIPRVMRQCTDVIRQHGMQVEGVFRQATDGAQLKMLQEQLNRGERVKLGDSADDVRTAASLMKSQLRQLPQPLLPHELYDDFVLSQTMEGDNQVTELQRLVTHLLPDNYTLLQYLTLFLTEVASHSAVNNMSAHNLALVFGPCLLWPRDSQASFASISAVNRCVEQLVCNYSHIFTH